MKTGFATHEEKDTLMLVKEPVTDHSWTYSKTSDGFLYKSNSGSVFIKSYPFHIEVRDTNGKLLTSTYHSRDNATDFTPVLPFSFVRRASDMSRSIAASFSLSPGEKIFGCGELLALDNRDKDSVMD
jgi:alpha-D-xyloside xylohydrolase